MKIVIQRVTSAKVISDKKVVGQIGKGLFLLVGVGKDDRLEDVAGVAEKIVNMRLMSDESGKMNLSVKDAGVEILVVSQFTLYADTSGGRRPSFVHAAGADLAREIYEKFVSSIKEQDVKVETGSFGNYMEIDAKLDGPVTIVEVI